MDIGLHGIIQNQSRLTLLILHINFTAHCTKVSAQAAQYFSVIVSYAGSFKKSPSNAGKLSPTPFFTIYYPIYYPLSY